MIQIRQDATSTLSSILPIEILTLCLLEIQLTERFVPLSQVGTWRAAVLKLCHTLCENPTADGSCRAVLLRVEQIDKETRDDLSKRLDNLASMDNLLDFLTDASTRLLDTEDSSGLERIRRFSYMGVFIRKLALTAKRMDFDALVNLHEDWTRFKTSDADLDIKKEDQTAKFRGLQAALNVNSMDKHEPRYLAFISAWKGGDYSAAIAALSQYFDHAVSDNGKGHHQYALLNLALLQSDFGCHKEALWAIYETIDAARDHQDDICLNFALSWLADVAANQPGILKQDSMLVSEDSRQYIIRSARANNLPELESLAHLVKARSTTGKEAYELINEAERVMLDANLDLSPRHFKIKAEWWKQADMEELQHVYLSLAMSFSDTESDCEDAARLRCYIADVLVAQGEIVQAEEILASSSQYSMQHHIYHKWITIQRSIVKLATNHYTDRDLVHETMKIEDDPLHVEVRVKRYLCQDKGAEAMDELTKYLAPKQNQPLHPLNHATYLRLLTEIYLCSSEPQRAFSTIARAQKCALEHSLFREIRLNRALYPRVKAALEGG